MGQDIVTEFLKQHIGTFFSAEDMAKQLKINRQSVTSTMKKLENQKVINVKVVMGKSSHPMKMYSHKKTDDHFEDVIHEIETLKNEQRFSMVSLDTLRQLILIKELKKLNEALKHGNGK